MVWEIGWGSQEWGKVWKVREGIRVNNCGGVGKVRGGEIGEVSRNWGGESRGNYGGDVVVTDERFYYLIISIISNIFHTS